MPPALPRRLPARTEDVALHMMAALSVPQIHGVLDFDGPLDGPRLKRALRLLLDAEPVLGCRFVARWWRPYWHRIAPRVLDAAVLLREQTAGGPYREALTADFLAETMPADVGPRIAALWLRDDPGDRLVLKIHHQAADAGGIKEVLYRLAALYRALGDDPEHVPSPRTGTRSLRQVFRPLLPRAIPGLLLRMLRDTSAGTWPPRHMHPPMGNDLRGTPSFRALHVPSDRMDALRAAFPSATINDLVTAAVLRALAGVAHWKGREALRIWSTVDLRRYLPDGKADGLSNLSGFMYLNVGTRLGDRYEDTLSTVKAALDRIKGLYPGLGYALTTWLFMGPLPLGLIDTIMPLLRRVMLSKMPPVLTNMGAIDDEALDLGEPKLRSAHLVVPTSHPPGLILGVSGFRGGVTLTVGHFASALPAESLETLLAAIDKELPG